MWMQDDRRLFEQNSPVLCRKSRDIFGGEYLSGDRAERNQSDGREDLLLSELFTGSSAGSLASVRGQSHGWKTAEGK